MSENSNIIDVTETEFNDQVIEASENKLIVVDFWAPWCGPCKTFAPTFEQAARELEPKLRFAKLNTEAQQSIAGRWNIRSIPTLILYQNGKEIARQAGAMPLAQLKQWLSQNGIA